MFLIVFLALLYLLNRLVNQLHCPFPMAALIRRGLFEFVFCLMQMAKSGAHMRLVPSHLSVQRGIPAQPEQKRERAQSCDQTVAHTSSFVDLGRSETMPVVSGLLVPHFKLPIHVCYTVSLIAPRRQLEQ